METILSIIALIVMALVVFVDWSTPDKPAQSTHHSDSFTVDANNRRKREQIARLNAKVAKLNAKHPDREFYRDGAWVKERKPNNVSHKSERP